MHSRDIPDNALSTATNVQVTKDGAIEPISNVIQLPNAVNSTINLQSYTSGNSVYSFKSDYGLGCSILLLGSKDMHSTLTNHVRFYTQIEHGFNIGQIVTLSGVHEHFQGHHEIVEVNDSFSFDIISANHTSVHEVVYGDITIDDTYSDLEVALTNDVEDNIVVSDAPPSPSKFFRKF